MSQPAATSSSSTLSPCIGLCQLDDRGFCEGCLRSGAEIAAWRDMDDGERLRLMREVLPLREALR